MIDPGNLSRNAVSPPVHVEEVLAHHKTYSSTAGVRLPPRTRDLEIDYAALSFVAPQKVRFRYKLEGRDAVPAGRDLAHGKSIHLRQGIAVHLVAQYVIGAHGVRERHAARG